VKFKSILFLTSFIVGSVSAQAYTPDPIKNYNPAYGSQGNAYLNNFCLDNFYYNGDDWRSSKRIVLSDIGKFNNVEITDVRNWSGSLVNGLYCVQNLSPEILALIKEYYIKYYLSDFRNDMAKRAVFTLIEDGKIEPSIFNDMIYSAKRYFENEMSFEERKNSLRRLNYLFLKDGRMATELSKKYYDYLDTEVFTKKLAAQIGSLQVAELLIDLKGFYDLSLTYRDNRDYQSALVSQLFLDNQFLLSGDGSGAINFDISPELIKTCDVDTESINSLGESFLKILKQQISAGEVVSFEGRSLISLILTCNGNVGIVEEIIMQHYAGFNLSIQNKKSLHFPRASDKENRPNMIGYGNVAHAISHYINSGNKFSLESYQKLLYSRKLFYTVVLPNFDIMDNKVYKPIFDKLERARPY